MTLTNLSAPTTATPNPTKPSRYFSLAGLVAATTLLAGCSTLLDLSVTNTCGQAVVVGIEGTVESPLDGWYPVADGTELIVDVGGFSKVLVTVVPDGADQIFDHTEVKLGNITTTKPNGSELAELDLATAGFCP